MKIQPINIQNIETKVLKILTRLEYESEILPKKYNRFPDNGLALGKGLVPTDLQSIKREAIDFDEIPLDGDDETAVSSTLKYLYVKDFKSVKEELKVDISASASYLGAKAEFSQKKQFDTSYSENSITILIQAYSDFGRFGMANDKLNEEAKNLIDNDQQEFIARFGTRYIALVSKMISLNVIIRIESVSNKLKQTLNEMISVEGSYGALSAKAKYEVNKALTKENSKDTISIEVFAIGGTGVEGLKDMVIGQLNSSDPLNQIGINIFNTLKTFKKVNSIAYELISEDFRQYGLTEEPKLKWSLYRKNTLIKLKDMYDELKYHIEIYEEVIKNRHPLNFIIPPSEMQFILSHTNDIDIYYKRLAEIELHHKNCRENPDDSSFFLPNFSCQIFDNNLLKRCELKRLRFYAYNDELKTIDNTKLYLILKESIFDREDYIKALFPTIKRLLIQIDFEYKEGVKYIEFHDSLTLTRRKDGHNWQGQVIRLIGDNGNFMIIPANYDFVNPENSNKDYFGNDALEKYIFNELNDRKFGNLYNGELVNYKYELYYTVIDNADRKYTFLFMETDFDLIYPNDIDNRIKHNSTEYYI